MSKTIDVILAEIKASGYRKGWTKKEIDLISEIKKKIKSAGINDGLASRKFAPLFPGRSPSAIRQKLLDIEL